MRNKDMWFMVVLGVAFFLVIIGFNPVAIFAMVVVFIIGALMIRHGDQNNDNVNRN